MQQNQRYHLVCSKHSSSFLKPGAYITHNAMWPEWHHCMHFIRLHAASSGATNGIITLFFTYAVVFPRTFKHTLVCRIAVAILLTALIQPHRWNDCRFLFVIQMLMAIFVKVSWLCIYSLFPLSSCSLPVAESIFWAQFFTCQLAKIWRKKKKEVEL